MEAIIENPSKTGRFCSRNNLTTFAYRVSTVKKLASPVQIIVVYFLKPNQSNAFLKYLLTRLQKSSEVSKCYMVTLAHF